MSQMNAIYVLYPAGTIAVLFFSFFMFKRQNAREIVYSNCNCNCNPSNIVNFVIFLYIRKI